MPPLIKSTPPHNKDILLAKHVSREKDNNAESIVEAWLSANQQNRDLAKKVELIWDKSKKLGFAGNLDIDMEWEGFKKRIDFKTSAAPTRKGFFRSRLGAAAMLAIGVGLALFILLPSKKTNQALVEIFSGKEKKMDTLPDGSIVRLEPNSRLSYFSSFFANHRAVKFSGNAFFSVQPDHRNPFTVTTGNLRVTVLGTSFRIDQTKDSTEISVSAGVVEVSGIHEKIVLHAGDKLNVAPGDMPWRRLSPDSSSRRLPIEKRPLAQSATRKESLQTRVFAPHALLVGDYAPILPLDTWLKGGPINIYEKGKVYLIDFWALWCGPCLADMGHLSELQQKYKDRGFEVIGATSEDSWGNTHPKVVNFIGERGKQFNYNFAWMPDSYRPDHRYRSVIYNPWLELAYDSSGWALPQIFIIDRQGKIAFIGDGYGLEESYLVSILDGSYDTALERKKYLEKIDMENQVTVFVDLLSRKEMADATSAGKAIIQNPGTTSHVYMAMADAIFNSHADIRTPELLLLGMEAARKGVKSTASRSPGHLSLLARGYFLMGEPGKAVSTIKIAVSMAEGSFREALEKDMQTYEQAIKNNNGH